jgi:hypothetical protein
MSYCETIKHKIFQLSSSLYGEKLPNNFEEIDDDYQIELLKSSQGCHHANMAADAYFNLIESSASTIEKTFEDIMLLAHIDKNKSYFLVRIRVVLDGSETDIESLVQAQYGAAACAIAVAKLPSCDHKSVSCKLVPFEHVGVLKAYLSEAQINTTTDLFEDLESLPHEVGRIVQTYIGLLNEGAGDGYVICSEFLQKVQAHGYTFEYGLSAEPYDLCKI